MKKRISRWMAILLAASLLMTGCKSSGQNVQGSSAESSSTKSSNTENSSAESSADDSKSSDPAEGQESEIRVAVCGEKAGASGFTDEGIAGADWAREELGITVDYIECKDTADYETNGRFLSESGEYDLIIFINSQIADIVSLFCDDYPEQKYSIVDCKLEGKDNVRSVGAINGEQHFLTGVLCGLITTGKYQDDFPLTNDSNVLCYAGGTDSPTSREGAAGFMAGAKYVNPDAEILYTIVGGYNDPATAKEISLLGIDKGADICTGNCGSGVKGILEACKEKGAYYIATSLSDNDPNQSLCCSIKKTDVLVFNEVKAVVDGSWSAGYNEFGIADGVCDISFEDSLYAEGIPEEVKAVIDQVRQDCKDGKITMPADVSDVDAWAAENQYQW
ncbi:MAG: BMP family ABC transporter substrate-binding protein [Lachnospiraceae bacterium]|jgi:basic membrane protein A|nr:BMP family ABC transporter substrate-binding protein [Lachnospiraceae bacterium]